MLASSALFWAGGPVYAQTPGDWRTVTVEVDSGARIEGLMVSPLVTQVKYKKEESGITPVVVLTGQFNRPDWALFYKKQWLVKTSATQRDFRFVVPLGGPVTLVKLGAVGPTGKVQDGGITLQFKGWDEFVKHRDQKRDLPQAQVAPKDPDSSQVNQSAQSNKEKPARFKPKTTYLTVSLGVASVAYTETNIANFSMTALTPKVAIQFPIFKPNFDLVLNGYTNVYTLSSNRPDVSVRFTGINGRLGYRLPFIKRPWSLSVLGGWYFTTMNVTGNAFGFRNLSGPQLFPLLSRQLNSRSSVYAYFKFAPILAVSFAPSDNREIALGTGYVRFLDNGRPLSLNLDYSSFKFILTGTKVSSNSISFGVTYGLF